MPALVNSRLGSLPGTSGALGTIVCPRSRKKSRNDCRIWSPVTGTRLSAASRGGNPKAGSRAVARRRRVSDATVPCGEGKPFSERGRIQLLVERGEDVVADLRTRRQCSCQVDRIVSAQAVLLGELPCPYRQGFLDVDRAVSAPVGIEPARRSPQV